jgi:GGDEF domain-containing protein
MKIKRGGIKSWVNRFKDMVLGQEEITTVLTLECEGMEELGKTYGPEAAEYVRRTMMRLLADQSRVVDLVYRRADGAFEVVMDGATPFEAEWLLARVEASFSKALFDAGYECDLSYVSESGNPQPIDNIRLAVR